MSDPGAGGDGRSLLDRLRRRRPGDRRVRTPTVLQMETVECGAAALGIVLGYYGRFVSLERLRVDCGVSRDGSNANNVLKASRKYGMTARGCRKEVQQLRALQLPLILFWNFNHFVVLEGWRGDKVYLNDPATGPRVVTASELDSSFTGVVLVLAPGPEFEPGGERHRLWRGLRTRFRGSERALAYAALAGLLLVVPGLVIPTLGRVFVDHVLVGGLDDWLRPLLLALAVTAGLRAVLTWLQQRYLLRLETKLALTTSARFFWHVLRLPAEFFAQRFAGDIATRVGLNDNVARLLSERLASTVLSAVMVVFFAALMLQYDVALTCIAVAIALVNVLALKLVSRLRVDQNQRFLQEGAKLTATSMQGLTVIETLKSSGGEMGFFARWAGYQAKVLNAQQRLDLSTRMLNEVPPLLGALNAMAILSLGGLRVIDGHMSMGMLVAFQSLSASFMAPIGGLVALGATVQDVEADMNRLDDVLGHRTDPLLDSRAGAGADAAGGDAPPTRLAGQLQLRAVTFGYSRLGQPLIRNFDLSLAPGARVALVGSSGSGKSTVAKLVAGLYEPWEGDILFDGQPRSAWDRELLTNSVAMVDQDIFLMAGTVRDNLTLWDDTVEDTALIGAAKDACIHDEVTARPGGYDAELSEGGRNLSGGQRQRLEIARALIVDPSLLIMDEASSALDPTTEAAVDDNLRRRGCTALIVAHRLSTIRDCDEILVLEKGRVVQRGTHAELLAAGGAYARLIAEA